MHRKSRTVSEEVFKCNQNVPSTLIQFVYSKFSISVWQWYMIVCLFLTTVSFILVYLQLYLYLYYLMVKSKTRASIYIFNAYRHIRFIFIASIVLYIIRSYKPSWTQYSLFGLITSSTGITIYICTYMYKPPL